MNSHDQALYELMSERYEEKTAALEVAQRERDAALFQAAGLREALTQVSTLAGNWQTQDQIYDIMREALATPGPTIGELQAEAKAEEMDRWAELWWNDHSEITSCDFSERARELRSFAARLRGGGK